MGGAEKAIQVRLPSRLGHENASEGLGNVMPSSKRHACHHLSWETNGPPEGRCEKRLLEIVTTGVEADVDQVDSSIRVRAC
jgi:hypothetical protein